MELNPLEDLFKAHRELEMARSNYDRGLIRERIRQIEKILKNNPMQPVKKEQEVSKVVAIEETQETHSKVFMVDRIENKTINVEENEYDTARIANVKQCQISVRTAHSTYIQSADSSLFYITAQQIRVNSCRNVTIYAYTATGVYIEDSTDVKVLEYTPKVLPAYANHVQVYDFNRGNAI
ncbi:hypothetical protein NEMIN01_0843 [Nematocida minor]|uniref:uncharacterized protein n=1 Tax=Nematocida minor TaxID=1912983 RepID=UPI00221E6430|nr:uncharacterized protein NEMIN01_0843 [Nematocida minor]KAI5190058.1 hypothetical protein NEMIN01_0843 [Nematocida minor]